MNCLYCLPAGKGKLIEQLKIDVPIYGISPLTAKSKYKRILFFLVAMSNTFTTSNSTQWRKREGAQIVAGWRIIFDHFHFHWRKIGDELNGMRRSANCCGSEDRAWNLYSPTSHGSHPPPPSQARLPPIFKSTTTCKL